MKTEAEGYVHGRMMAVESLASLVRALDEAVNTPQGREDGDAYRSAVVAGVLTQLIESAAGLVASQGVDRRASVNFAIEAVLTGLKQGGITVSLVEVVGARVMEKEDLS